MSDDIKPIDLLAGEYVLGLLEGEERVAATLRAETDPEFRVRVEFWETRLASLLETLEERPAPPQTKARIEAALFGVLSGKCEFVSAVRGRAGVWQQGVRAIREGRHFVAIGSISSNSLEKAIPSA